VAIKSRSVLVKSGLWFARLDILVSRLTIGSGWCYCTRKLWLSILLFLHITGFIV
jgi:hypothetical protein